MSMLHFVAAFVQEHTVSTTLASLNLLLYVLERKNDKPTPTEFLAFCSFDVLLASSGTGLLFNKRGH